MGGRQGRVAETLLQGFPKWGPWTSSSGTPGNLLEIQIPSYGPPDLLGQQCSGSPR